MSTTALLDRAIRLNPKAYKNRIIKTDHERRQRALDPDQGRLILTLIYGKDSSLIIVCGAGSTQRTVSLCLSVHLAVLFARCSVRRVYCWGTQLSGQIDRLLHGRRSAAAACECGQCHVVSIRTQLNTLLLRFKQPPTHGNNANTVRITTHNRSIHTPTTLSLGAVHTYAARCCAARCCYQRQLHYAMLGCVLLRER